ncbi:MAG: hypothetical protein WA919_29760 [Coleofasciculaceae cyanobacterium]
MFISRALSRFRFVILSFATAGLIVVSSCNNNPAPTNSPSDSNQATTIEQPAAPLTEKDDVSYMTALGLMKGHLMVAKELLNEGKPEEAEPHIGHPVEEIYGDIEGQLEQRNVEEFKPTLNKLNDTVKSAPKAPELTPQYQEAMQEIDGAIAALPEEQRQSPEFLLQVVNQMLNVAGEEYEAAIADGKFVEILEYQDSRGFVLYSEELYRNISSQMSEEHAEASQAIESSLTELKTAWPSVNPPETPIKSPEEVSGLVATIKENSQKVAS